MSSNHENAAIGAAESMSLATRRLRERAHLLTGMMPYPAPHQVGPEGHPPYPDGHGPRGVTVEDQLIGGRSVVRLAGEIDYYSAASLRQELVDRIAIDPNLVIDLDGVGFLDSVGLSVLIGVFKRARRAGGMVHLVATRPEITLLFRVTGVQRALPLHESVAAALTLDA